MLTKSTVATNNITSLDPEPNDVQGLTDADLQAKFDQYGVDNNAFINDVLTVEQDTVNTSLQDQITINSNDIATIGGELSGIVLGQIPDNTITDAKLSNEAGQIKDTFTAHLADEAYQLAGGTATVITLTTATLADGYAKSFVVATNNGGAATTINGKHLYKPNTTTAPTLTAGKAVTVWYNLAGDCFFIKASAEGDAIAAHVLAGDTFSNDVDTGIVGTMVSNVGSAMAITPSGVDQAIPQGYYGGSTADGKVSALNVSAGDNVILSQPTSVSLAATTFTKIHEVQTGTAGVYRLKFDLRINIAGTTANAQIYKNGVAVGTLRATSLTAFTTFTEDLTFDINDLIQFYAKTNDSSKVFSLANCNICCAIQYPTLTVNS